MQKKKTNTVIFQKRTQQFTVKSTLQFESQNIIGLSKKVHVQKLNVFIKFSTVKQLLPRLLLMDGANLMLSSPAMASENIWTKYFFFQK